MSTRETIRSSLLSCVVAIATGVVTSCSSGGEGSSDTGLAANTTAPGTSGAGAGAAPSPANGAANPATNSVASPGATDPNPVATSPAGGDTLLLDNEPAAAVAPAPTMELTEQTACAGLEVTPEEVEVEVPMEITTTMDVLSPVALYIVLDNSGSMNDVPGQDDQGGGGGNDESDDPNSKWNQATTALSEFANDPGSVGIDIAIQYFHPDNQDDDSDEDDPAACDGTRHAVPDVPIGPLPDNAEAITTSLDDAEPNGNTPTVGALAGGVQFCQAFQAENPEEACVVVLVTDGQPNGCELSNECPDNGDCVDPNAIPVLTALAATGLANGVQTFTVGMNGITTEGFDLLDAIAVAGGTDCTPGGVGDEACDVSLTGSQGLLDAMNAIRESVSVTETVTETTTVIETQTLACQWGIPAPPPGATFDAALVNVTLSIAGGPAENIGGVPSEAECTTSGGFGWYYDDPAAPTTIHACPESCALIEAAMDPVVSVLLGCAMEPPRATAGAR